MVCRCASFATTTSTTTSSRAAWTSCTATRRCEPRWPLVTTTTKRTGAALLSRPFSFARTQHGARTLHLFQRPRMATTAGDIIKRALRICRVADSNTALNENDAADALGTLNGMIAEWHEADIGLPDYS